MKAKPAERFWQETTLTPHDAGWQVFLDARPLNTPAGAVLLLPKEALAEAIRQEWDAQHDYINANTMPMFRQAVTALDRIAPHRQQIIDELIGYGNNELLCYRAETPPALQAEQHRIWQPCLDWAQANFGFNFTTGAGIMPITQPPKNAQITQEILKAMDDFHLGGVANLIIASGSMVVGLGVAFGHLTPAQGFDVAFLEECWQAEQWGHEAEAKDRRARIKEDMIEAHRYLSLLKGEQA